MSPVTFEFTVDCADAAALCALCAAPLPPGISARCVSHAVPQGTGYGRVWRARIRVRRGTRPGLVAAWLRTRLEACATPWHLDGIPVTAGHGPRWLGERPAGGLVALPRLAIRRA